MVKNEIDMITRGKYLLPILCMGLLGGAVDAQDFDVKWKSTRMDGSRTGVVLSAADNVKESMGELSGQDYDRCAEGHGCGETGCGLFT